MRRLVGPVGAGVAVAIVASFTTAFSTGAEVVTGSVIGLFVVAEIAVLTWRPATGRPRREGMKASDQARPTPARKRSAPSVGFAIWGALAAVAIAFELWNYFLSPRIAHPTVSYFLTEVAAQPWSRGVLFAAWLALGAYLVRR